MEGMEIRDTRNGSWYWVNTAVNACPHISSTDKVVYSALCTFAGCQEIHPSYLEISKRSALSVRRCKESVQKLIKVGYISVEKGGGKGNSNVYVLLKVPKGCEVCTVSNGADSAPFPNGAENDTQTVRIPSSNGADSAPQLDKELNKDNICVSNETQGDISFISSNWIEQCCADQREHIRLIGNYMKIKKMDFPSKKTAEAELKRNLKTATLLKDYPAERRKKALMAAAKMTSQWTLETILKYLNK